MTECRCRKVVEMRDVGTPRSTESSFRDSGLKARIIAPRTRLMSTNNSGSSTSEKACSRISEYRESTPARPSCDVPLVLERSSWSRSFGSWCSDSMNLIIVEAKINSPDDFLVSASISLSLGHGLGRSRSLLCRAMVVNLCVKYNWISW